MNNYNNNNFNTNYANNYNNSNINEKLGSNSIQTKRKFSFPATLHSTTLFDIHQTPSRRRLSNVSDVVTRKLSYTIGWKASQIPAQDIVTQGRCLCGQYIKRRLRRSGLFNKKLGLQRIRSILGTTTMAVVREVFPAVTVVYTDRPSGKKIVLILVFCTQKLGDELERMHPRIYTGVARQICRNPGGELQSADNITVLLSAVARDLFRLDITWSKVVSLFAIAGGLSVDCVRQGHPEYLPKLMQSVCDVIEDELVPWINENGGWLGIHSHVLPASNNLNPLEWTTLLIGGIFALFLFYVILKFVITCLIPNVYNRVLDN